jgi:hypothetical protein
MAVRLVAADGTARSPTPPKRRAASLDRIEFAGPHTERSRYRLVLPTGLSDDAGRPLANAARFPLDIATGDFPPLAKFAGTFGILECQMGGHAVFARFAALGHDLTKGRHERFLGNGKGTGFMKVHRHPHRTIKRLRKFFQQGGVSQNGCVRSFH